MNTKKKCTAILFVLFTLLCCNPFIKKVSATNQTEVVIKDVTYRYLPNKDAYEIVSIPDNEFNSWDGMYLELEAEINGKPVMSIGQYARGTTDHEEVMPYITLKLSRNIKRIESHAFTYSATKIIFNDRLEYIDTAAFLYCGGLGKNFTIPGNVKYIGSWAFAYTALQNVRLENGVIEIGERAFEECNLKNVYIPSSVKKIGKNAFYGRDDNEFEYPLVKPTIYCEPNSVAHKYAIKNKYPYKLSDVDGQIAKTSLSVNATYYNGASLNWKKLSNVSGYRLYRSTSGKDGSWKAIKNIAGKSSSTYQDTTALTGQTYYYTIKGYKKVGSYTKVGNYKSNVVKVTPRLKTPVITKAVSSKKGIAQFKWNKVSGMTGYQLWRATTPKGTYKRIKVVRTPETEDTTAKKGKTYYYKIRAYRKVDGRYVYSKWSDVKPLKVKS